MVLTVRFSYRNITFIKDTSIKGRVFIIAHRFFMIWFGFYLGLIDLVFPAPFFLLKNNNINN